MIQNLIYCWHIAPIAFCLWCASWLGVYYSAKFAYINSRNQ